MKEKNMGEFMMMEWDERDDFRPPTRQSYRPPRSQYNERIGDEDLLREQGIPGVRRTMNDRIQEEHELVPEHKKVLYQSEKQTLDTRKETKSNRSTSRFGQETPPRLEDNPFGSPALAQPFSEYQEFEYERDQPAIPL